MSYMNWLYTISIFLSHQSYIYSLQNERIVKPQNRLLGTFGNLRFYSRSSCIRKILRQMVKNFFWGGGSFTLRL